MVRIRDNASPTFKLTEIFRPSFSTSVEAMELVALESAIFNLDPSLGTILPSAKAMLESTEGRVVVNSPLTTVSAPVIAARKSFGSRCLNGDGRRPALAGPKVKLLRTGSGGELEGTAAPVVSRSICLDNDATRLVVLSTEAPKLSIFATVSESFAAK
jgi:hypothetical protein